MYVNIPGRPVIDFIVLALGSVSHHIFLRENNVTTNVLTILVSLVVNAATMFGMVLLLTGDSL